MSTFLNSCGSGFILFCVLIRVSNLDCMLSRTRLKLLTLTLGSTSRNRISLERTLPVGHRTPGRPLLDMAWSLQSAIEESLCTQSKLAGSTMDSQKHLTSFVGKVSRSLLVMWDGRNSCFLHTMHCWVVLLGFSVLTGFCTVRQLAS